MARGFSAALAGVTALAFASLASAADKDTLKRLRADPPQAMATLSGQGTLKPLRFSRAVVDLRAEPWAWIEVVNIDHTSTAELATWKDGEVEVNVSTLSGIFNDVMKQAGASLDGASTSLFSTDSSSTDLQVGARIDRMNGRFCRACKLLHGRNTWDGAVQMEVQWEIYSSLERKVVATMRTRGSAGAPSAGIPGDPDVLVFEAFRDNVRHLTTLPELRQVLTSGPAPAPVQLAAMTFASAPPASRPIATVGGAVAAIYSGDALGTGFLISTEGHLLTNQHVVGGAKYVKVRWQDGSETVAEVLRADRRRDIAVVKVGPPGRAPLALRRGVPNVGDSVFAVGTPLDSKFQGSVTKGIVSAMRVYDGDTFIQSDVTVNNGNSGGPLVDESGAVIGVTVSGIDINGAPVGINLFIPISDALKALNLQPAG